MTRSIKYQDKAEQTIDFLKNFHDEREWRYVPDPDSLTEAKKDPIIANPRVSKYKGRDNCGYKCPDGILFNQRENIYNFSTLVRKVHTLSEVSDIFMRMIFVNLNVQEQCFQI